MLRSLNAGVSGLRSHQTMMDVVGNNIANVNTSGFKSSAVSFTDLLSQMIRGSGSPSAGQAGTNSAQIGLGVKVGGVSTNFAQGASQLTGRTTDVSIQGDGFLMAKSGGGTFYTRNGNLGTDVNGFLSTVEGAYIQGWQANAVGAVNTSATPSNIQIPIGRQVAPSQTNNITLAGNIDSTRALASPVQTQIKTYDAQGRELEISIALTRTATNVWSAQPTNVNTGAVIGPATVLTWNPGTNTWSGNVSIAAADLNASNPAPLASRNFVNPIVVNFGSVTQFGGSDSLAATTQDGYQQGSLQSFSIGSDGTISGSFTNGVTRVLAQISLAVFNNPSGLEKTGGSLYRESVNSGLAQIGTASTGGRGLIAGGTLEMSNVDLAAEFTNLIVAERGFLANSRVITTSDEILQDLVNLKR